MSKLVFLADAHVHPWRLCSRDGGHDRLMDGLSVVQQSLDLARESGAAWVFAGDMKQPKTSWPQQALTGLHALFRKYKDVEMVLVCGNHDAEGEGGSGLAPFKDVATVVERAEAVCLRDGAILVCCPWNGDRGEAARLLALPLADGARVLVAHGFLQGCALGPEDVRIAKGTPIAEYGDFDLAVFGDVHKTQWRVPEAPGAGRPAAWVPFPTGKTTIPRGSVLYCGSPYQQNWGERNDGPKGALVIDLEDLGTAELVPLAAPQYAHLEMDYDSAADFLKGSPDPGHFYRIVYSGALCGVTDRLREWGESCRSFQLIVRRPEKSAKRADVHAGMSRRELLEGYVTARPPVRDLKGHLPDAARVIEVGVRLMETES